MKSVKGISIFLLLSSVTAAGFQNCGPGFEALQVAESLTSVASSFPVITEKRGCKFVGPDVLADRIKNKLGIAGGDFPVLNLSGQEDPNVLRLTSNLDALGKGNIAKGTFDDFSCGAVRFKAAMEVMIDACALALKDRNVQNRLFPRGPRDFEEVYRAFIGRSPTDMEHEVLLDLVNSAPVEKREIMACGVVASSFEALITI
mgnify:CR=1 FL=1